MQFDFERFTMAASSVYPKGSLYSFQEMLFVFKCYFEAYERHAGSPHPPIRAAQVEKIMEAMPWVCEEDMGSYNRSVEPEEYEAMIARHFETKYRACDYNINHFFSGRIRELRFREACL